MLIDLLTSAVVLSILLAPVIVPVCTHGLYLACLRYRPDPGQDPLTQPKLEFALFYGAVMATVPVSGVGICLMTLDLLRALKIYHAPPLAVITASGLAILGAGICYATILTVIVPVTYRQAVMIQERIVGLPFTIFIPFWAACLL